MAATAKQLAALKKGREAMAKKRAAGTVKKRVAKKPAAKRKAPVVKKNPAKSAPKYSVKITLKDDRVGYLTHAMTLDSEKSKAAKVSLTNAEKEATNYFNSNKRYIHKAEVIPAPKS